MDDQQARQRVRSAASAHRQSRRQFRASRWLLSGAPARGRCGVPPIHAARRCIAAGVAGRPRAPQFGRPSCAGRRRSEEAADLKERVRGLVNFRADCWPATPVHPLPYCRNALVVDPTGATARPRQCGPARLLARTCTEAAMECINALSVVCPKVPCHRPSGALADVERAYNRTA